MQKYFYSRFGQITSTTPPFHPVTRGVGHRHERWNGMRWTRQRWASKRSQGGFPVSDYSAQTNDVAAYGKTAWSWHPLLVSSRRRFLRAQPGAIRPLIR